GRLHLGDALSVDQCHAEPREFGAHGLLHASPPEVGAACAADHGHVCTWPGGFYLASRFDPRLGPADNDDTHRVATTLPQPCAQRGHSARPLAALEPICMHGGTRNVLRVDMRAKRVDRLSKRELLLAVVDDEANATRLRIEPAHLAADKLHRGPDKK